MSRWMSLLLAMAAACGLFLDSASDLFGFHDGMGPEAAPQRTVHVHAPPGVEAAGSHVPLLYLEEGRALFFPEGAASAAHARIPGPGELVALGRRQDIVIITIVAESSTRAATAPAGWTRYVRRLVPHALFP
ncbi:hypothetical protein ACLESD_44495 [Pyxidicoccus sp. 3LFB2]